MPLKESLFPASNFICNCWNLYINYKECFSFLSRLETRNFNKNHSRLFFDIPMAQYIINMNASLPASDKFIIHILDNTHMFVQPHVEQMIRSRIAKFREDNTYVKPN
ncbi:General transcription and DNA repair factor IIH subunit TFB5 [Glycine soja]